MNEFEKNNFWLNVRGEDRDISDIFAKKLSGIVIHFGVFENCLLLHLVSIRQTFPILKDRCNNIPGNFIQKIKLWRNSVHYAFKHDELFLDNCEQLFRYSIAISRLRNSLIHGIWTVDPNGSDNVFRILFMRDFESRDEVSYMNVDVDYVTRLQEDCLFLATFMNEILINQMIRTQSQDWAQKFRMKSEIDLLDLQIY